jgi:hypothetical protein
MDCGQRFCKRRRDPPFENAECRKMLVCKNIRGRNRVAKDARPFPRPFFRATIWHLTSTFGGESAHRLDGSIARTFAFSWSEILFQNHRAFRNKSDIQEYWPFSLSIFPLFISRIPDFSYHPMFRSSSLFLFSDSSFSFLDLVWFVISADFWPFVVLSSLPHFSAWSFIASDICDLISSPFRFLSSSSVLAWIALFVRFLSLLRDALLAAFDTRPGLPFVLFFFSP